MSSLYAVKNVRESDMDSLIMIGMSQYKAVMDLFTKQIGWDDAKVVLGDTYRAIEGLGESDIVFVLEKEGKKHAIQVSDRANANASPQDPANYAARGQAEVDAGIYDSFDVFVIGPAKYLEENEAAASYPHKVAYEDIKSTLQNGTADMQDLEKLLDNCILKTKMPRQTRRITDPKFRRFGISYQDLWKCNTIWQIISNIADNNLLFRDFIFHQEMAMYNTTDNVKPLVIATAYTFRVAGIVHTAKGEITCQLKDNEAVINFDIFNNANEDSINEAVKKINHEHVVKYLSTMPAAGYQEGLNIEIDEANFIPGKHYAIKLTAVNGQAISPEVDDTRYWKLVAFFFAKYSRIFYERIEQRLISRYLMES